MVDKEARADIKGMDLEINRLQDRLGRLESKQRSLEEDLEDKQTDIEMDKLRGRLMAYIEQSKLNRPYDTPFTWDESSFKSPDLFEVFCYIVSKCFNQSRDIRELQEKLRFSEQQVANEHTALLAATLK